MEDNVSDDKLQINSWETKELQRILCTQGCFIDDLNPHLSDDDKHKNNKKYNNRSSKRRQHPSPT